MRLRREFIAADPFPHVIIDNLWPNELLRAAAAEFDSLPIDEWLAYNSDDERNKYTYCKRMPYTCGLLLSLLTSQSAADLCSAVTGIERLQPDPTLYGGGLHRTEPGGFLGLHLDNERHPLTGLVRRLNLIIYLTEQWQEEWGGHLELWDRARSRPVASILPTFGRTVLFETSSHSYHGHTKPLLCPSGVARKSIAVYFWSEARARARFLPSAGERGDQEQEARRLARSMHQ